MELFWRDEDLQFQIHMKDNQLLKYLNEGSAHTTACFKAITYGVLQRLSILTSLSPETENVPLNLLYPKHCKALEEAGLPVPKTYPTLLESIKEIQEKKLQLESAEADPSLEDEAAAKRKRDREQSTFFCIGFSGIWTLKPIHQRLKELRVKHGLTWLRNSMSYHKFSNLGQQLHNDLSRKLMKGTYDMDEGDKPCNCYATNKLADRRCFHDNNCRKSMVVYNLHCEICDKDYVGKTQNHFKK
jgi:hypothetical protein